MTPRRWLSTKSGTFAALADTDLLTRSLVIATDQKPVEADRRVSIGMLHSKFEYKAWGEFGVDLSAIPPLQEFIRARRSTLVLPDIERAVLENFGAEERISDARRAIYAPALGAKVLASIGDFKQAHERRYLFERIQLEKTGLAVPDTFDPALNGDNHWSGIDDSVALYRIESASFALSGTGIDEEELERAIALRDSIQADKRDTGRAVLQRLMDNWNDRRDRRPLFATTEDEISELLTTSGNDWPNALRDHLGLGHFNPAAGRPERVLLMRYSAREVRECKAAGGSGFCIPTVLDGPLNPFFFPTPLTGAKASGSDRQVGRAVNLRAIAKQSDYKMGLELIHSYVNYRPEHLIQSGLISRSLSSNLAQLRSFHLAWLRLETDRDNFGCDLAHV
jgi:hypothetical protein